MLNLVGWVVFGGWLGSHHHASRIPIPPQPLLQPSPPLPFPQYLSESVVFPPTDNAKMTDTEPPAAALATLERALSPTNASPPQDSASEHQRHAARKSSLAMLHESLLEEIVDEGGDSTPGHSSTPPQVDDPPEASFEEDTTTTTHSAPLQDAPPESQETPTEGASGDGSPTTVPPENSVSGTQPSNLETDRGDEQESRDREGETPEGRASANSSVGEANHVVHNDEAREGSAEDTAGETHPTESLSTEHTDNNAEVSPAEGSADLQGSMEDASDGVRKTAEMTEKTDPSRETTSNTGQEDPTTLEANNSTTQPPPLKTADQSGGNTVQDVPAAASAETAKKLPTEGSPSAVPAAPPASRWKKLQGNVVMEEESDEEEEVAPQVVETVPAPSRPKKPRKRSKETVEVEQPSPPKRPHPRWVDPREAKRQAELAKMRDNPYQYFTDQVLERKKKERAVLKRQREKSQMFNEHLTHEREMLKERKKGEEEAKARQFEERQNELQRQRTEREEQRRQRMQAQHATTGLRAPGTEAIPLHIAMQRKYEQDVLQPELQRRRQELRRIKERFASNPEGIHEHETGVVTMLKQRNAQRREEVRSQNEHHQSQVAQIRREARLNTKSLHNAIEADRLAREEATRKRQSIQSKIERKREYSKNVHDRLPPPVPRAVVQVTPAVLPSQKTLGNNYLREVADSGLFRKRQGEPKLPAEVPSPDRFVRAERARQGNDYMVAARKKTVLAGGVSVNVTPMAAPTDDLRPLRSKVRVLERALNDDILLQSASSNPDLLLAQQKTALNAAAAVKAKLDLLQQL